MEKAVANAKLPLPNANPLMSFILRLPKWKRFFYKAKKPAGGGCNCQIKALLPAHSGITHWPVIMKCRNVGCGLWSAKFVVDRHEIIIYCLSFKTSWLSHNCLPGVVLPFLLSGSQPGVLVLKN